MTLKTDKRSSLDHVMHYIDRKAEFGKTIPVAKAKRAAQYAFNAGRESVVENIPKLEFEQTLKGGIIAENTIFSESYHLCTKASTGKWSFYMGYETPVDWYDTSEEAIDAANDDYKKRIKQALEL